MSFGQTNDAYNCSVAVISMDGYGLTRSDTSAACESTRPRVNPASQFSVIGGEYYK